MRWGVLPLSLVSFFQRLWDFPGALVFPNKAKVVGCPKEKRMRLAWP